jgi:hypothetical protein
MLESKSILKITVFRLVLLTFSAFLVSCGVKKTPLAPKNTTTYSPELNKIIKAEIGVALATKENDYKYNAIKITDAFDLKLDYLSETIEAEKVFINDYNTKRYNLYNNSNYLEFGIAVPFNDESALIYTITDSDGIYTTGYSQSGINFIVPKEEIKFVHTVTRAREKDYFKQEFIYNGRVGDALKFIYREYINDYARPSFMQDLQYDLTEGNIVGIRGLRIEIIKATNTEIEYKVLSHFRK